MDESDPWRDAPTARLLRAWARERSETAFRALVTRHMDMVHSTAVRRLGAHRDAAPDVAQGVFLQLARRAEALPGGIVLGAWLHRQTVRQSLNHLRNEQRRRLREEATVAMNADPEPPSWTTLAPVLDEALASLPEKDRAVLHLRYFEDRRTSEIATTLAVSPEAAQKRLERALENLRERLRRKMAVPSAAALASWLSGRTVEAAPAGLAAKVSAAAVADTAGAGWLTGWWRALAARPATAISGAVLGSWLGWAVATASRPVTPPASGAALATSEAATSGPRAPRQLSSANGQVSLLAALERLGRLPANFRATVTLDAILQRPDAADMGQVVALAVEGLSEHTKPRVMAMLLKQWGDQNPRATMDFLVKYRAEPWTENRFWSVFHQWNELDMEEVSQWVLQQHRAGQTLGTGYDSLQSLAQQCVRSLTRADPEKGLRFFLHFPPAEQGSLIQALADDSGMERWRNGWPEENWTILADGVAAAVAAGRLEPEVLSRIVRRWQSAHPEPATAWQQAQPDDSAAAFYGRLTTRAGVGLWNEGEAREDVPAYQARLKDALALPSPVPLEERWRMVATTWNGPLPQLVEFLQAECPADGTGDAARHVIIRRLQGNMPSLIKSDPALRQAMFQAVEAITDPALREPLAIGLFRRWHEAEPAEAMEWLPQAGWSSARLETINRRLTPP